MNKLTCFIISMMCSSAALAANDDKSSILLDNSIESTGLELACYIDTPAYDVYTAWDCSYTTPATGTFWVSFKVQNTSGGSYSYAWNTTGWGSPTGCTSTSNICNVTLNRLQPVPKSKTMTVTVTDNVTSDSAVLSATAYLWW